MSKLDGFIDAHGLWNDEQKQAAKGVLACCRREGIAVRSCFGADPQGKLRQQDADAEHLSICTEETVSSLEGANTASIQPKVLLQSVCRRRQP